MCSLAILLKLPAHLNTAVQQLAMRTLLTKKMHQNNRVYVVQCLLIRASPAGLLEYISQETKWTKATMEREAWLQGHARAQKLGSTPTSERHTTQAADKEIFDPELTSQPLSAPVLPRLHWRDTSHLSADGLLDTGGAGSSSSGGSRAVAI